MVKITTISACSIINIILTIITRVLLILLMMKYLSFEKEFHKGLNGDERFTNITLNYHHYNSWCTNNVIRDIIDNCCNVSSFINICIIKPSVVT